MAMSRDKLKQTEIGEIPDGWKTLILRDVCQKIGSGATPRGGNGVYVSQGISLIRSQNIYNNRFNRDGLAFIGNEHADQLENVTLEKDDVLLNITGDSVARVCQVTDDVLPARVNQHVAIIRPREDILDSTYLRYYLANPSMQSYMLGLSSVGATRNALTKGMIESFEISVPSIPEQCAIAKILFDLDAKIELNHQMNKTLESIAQAIFKKWFVDNKNSVFCRASDLIEFDPWVSISKGKLLPFVEMKSLSEGDMIISNVERKPFSGGAKFQNNDTLLARITPCLENGKTGFVDFLEDQSEIAVGSTEFIVMRPRDGISAQFVYCLARDPRFRECAIQSMVGSSGRQRVQIDVVSNFEMMKPKKDLMIRFNAIAGFLFRQIMKNREESVALTKIRDSLLPKLMSGRIKVGGGV